MSLKSQPIISGVRRRPIVRRSTHTSPHQGNHAGTSLTAVIGNAQPRYGRSTWEDASTINETLIPVYDAPVTLLDVPADKPVRRRKQGLGREAKPVYDAETREKIADSVREAAPLLGVSVSYLFTVLRTTGVLSSGRRVTTAVKGEVAK